MLGGLERVLERNSGSMLGGLKYVPEDLKRVLEGTLSRWEQIQKHKPYFQDGGTVQYCTVNQSVFLIKSKNKVVMYIFAFLIFPHYSFPKRKIF